MFCADIETQYNKWVYYWASLITPPNLQLQISDELPIKRPYCVIIIEKKVVLPLSYEQTGQFKVIIFLHCW